MIEAIKCYKGDFVTVRYRNSKSRRDARHANPLPIISKIRSMPFST